MTKGNKSKDNKKKHKSNPVSFIEGTRVFRRIAEDIKKLLVRYGFNDSMNIIEKRDAINFIFNCVYFGAHSEGLNILRDKFLDGPQNEGTGILNETKKRKFLETDTSKNSFLERRATYNETIKYYGGHARNLGHYFRNIFQAVKYMDGKTFFTPKQKYEYITILRSQISVYEQEIFFYNSLSDLGGVWEWEKLQRNDYPTSSHQKSTMFEKLWITKYDLVRNTLCSKGNLIIGTDKQTHSLIRINMKEFYPLLTFEGQKEFEQCGAIPFHKNATKNNEPICRFCFNKKYIRYYEGDKAELKKAEEEIKETFPKGLPLDWPCQENPCETRIVVHKYNLGLK